MFELFVYANVMIHHEPKKDIWNLLSTETQYYSIPQNNVFVLYVSLRYECILLYIMYSYMR